MGAIYNRALLQWLDHMGIDDITGDEAVNHLTGYDKKSVSASSSSQQDIAMQHSSSESLTPLNSRSLADHADSLASLRQVVEQFSGLAIKKTATNTVFCDGNPQASVMFIGEAPGAEEDKQGIPFCGQSGQLLDTMLSFIDLRRSENFYITNTLFWRPPGNRRPTPEEIEICRPFVEKHIFLKQPKLLILVGGTAIASVLQENVGISRMRGQFFSYTNAYLKHAIPVTAIFHPAYLLRSPIKKKLVWQDLLMIRRYMREHAIQ